MFFNLLTSVQLVKIQTKKIILIIILVWPTNPELLRTSSPVLRRRDAEHFLKSVIKAGIVIESAMFGHLIDVPFGLGIE